MLLKSTPGISIEKDLIIKQGAEAEQGLNK
jgi:hypothetical protein